MTATDLRSVAVRLLGLPMAEYQLARQHADELVREFELMSRQAEMHPGSVPSRLLAVIGRLRGEYAEYTSGSNAELDAAVERGDDTIDLTVTVPASAADAARALGALLDEADDFCRQGDLLTLETPPRALRFRRWYLGEFIRQIDGEQPSRYPTA